MAPMKVHIKHAGKSYDIQLDPDLPPAVFKDAIYQVTGVPADRMKVMLKAGVLKDDACWKKIGPKEGQTFMVIGAAGELPKPPEKPVVFLEDMDDTALAEALAKPVGLTNLGNTCYMNSTVQAFRAIPELQVALSTPSLQSSTPLPNALRDLYSRMSQTTDSISPARFLQVLREVNPQFAEMDRSEKGSLRTLLSGSPYAQQDAEECYTAIVNSLRNVPGLDSAGNISTTGAEAVVGGSRFVEQYLMGRIHRELRCDDAPDEPPAISTEEVLKLDCNITIATYFMLSGIMNSLDQKVEKNSPSLGRQAIYSQRSRVSRLPAYLTVHMVRFAWREDINKKAKIMRRVKFPSEFDALELATEELRNKLLPASRKLKDIDRERSERRKVRKRTKQVTAPISETAPPASGSVNVTVTADVEMSDAAVVDGQLANSANSKDSAEDEFALRQKEIDEFSNLINEDVKKDIGASSTGLYDLVAIITHKGAAADGGHYMGFVKKSVFYAQKNRDKPAAESASGSNGVQMTVKELDEIEGDEDWYKFDDDKVSVFPKEKLTTLDGGGEDSSAYVLLYKSKMA